MHIRKLELQGFKSFADRASFQFGPGISGVVGPNGCGKSNVVDAVKWCLGEQSAKSLRGEAMQDVIFAGSSQRAAVGFAEVTLGFDAGDEPFPGVWARFSQLEVTRRLYRDGQSEYLVNQDRVRLRDIHELFMDTGVGNQLYSVIEQGRIGLIVHARPEQRRTLIEEAAGISKYKARREETMEKLGSTRASLERVSDLAEELGRQLRASERAVQRVGRWRALTARARQEEIALGLVRCAALVGDRRALSDQTRRAQEELDEAGRAVARHEEELAVRRAGLDALEEESGRARDRLAEVEAQRRVEE
ncbi:MAG: AAA family ATPase, partial [Myxococcota bacterium]